MMSRFRMLMDRALTRDSSREHPRGLKGARRVCTLVAVGVGALAIPGSAAAIVPPDVSGNYNFKTLDNNHDLTFNQLLGINDSNVIAGYFGSGQPGHPNKGYLLFPPYGQANYVNENFPHSAQTQVTGLNNRGLQVGFFVNKKGANFGFYAIHHTQFHKVEFPTKNNAKPHFEQLLGINDNSIAVGFYNDSHGTAHGYSYNIHTGQFHIIKVSGDTNVTAAAINNLGDVAGFATSGAATTEGFLKRSDGRVFHLNVPGATSTQALGVNNGDEVVGDYVNGSGTHGFAWSPGLGFYTVNDPNGVNNTTINGLDDRGALVGFYVDGSGNTDGLLATVKG